jgi:hypothetical protein
MKIKTKTKRIPIKETKGKYTFRKTGKIVPKEYFDKYEYIMDKKEGFIKIPDEDINPYLVGWNYEKGQRLNCP